MFLLFWLGALFGAIGSGIYIVVSLIIYIKERIIAKRENREIGPQYKGMLRNSMVLFLVSIILLGLFFGLAYLGMRGM